MYRCTCLYLGLCWPGPISTLSSTVTDAFAAIVPVSAAVAAVVTAAVVTTAVVTTAVVTTAVVSVCFCSQ